MSVRYVLAPEAALDLVPIWRYIKKQSSVAVAERVESVIRERIAFLARTPGAGHWSKNLTDEAVRFPGLFVPHRLPAGDEAVASCLHSSRPSERRTNSQGSFFIGRIAACPTQALFGRRAVDPLNLHSFVIPLASAGAA